MIVRTLPTAETTRRLVKSDGWESCRLLLKEDGMGFSFHITVVSAGAVLEMEYKNHLESVYCISGEGEIEDLTGGEIHPIKPGTLYALDRHDRHVVRAKEQMQLACVFNPPLIGNETHNADGSYGLSADPVTD